MANSVKAGGSTARFVDFWLLGGASIFLWFIFALAQYMRYEYSFVEQRLQQIAPTLLLLSLLVNHPHFMASYRLAYGRGFRFCQRHWFSTMLVPALLVLLFTAAYFSFEVSLYNVPWTLKVNAAAEALGFGYRLGETASLGTDLLGLSVLLMYLTVGWHYSKQVFGCAMVYANYDAYPISRRQRWLLKAGVFSVAFYSFCHISLHWRNYGASGSFGFLGVPVTELGIPEYFETVANALVASGIVAITYGVIYENYRRAGKLPSLNFLVPLVAFYVWWIPLFPQKEYYLMFVPFFHSLQYLAFAYRVEKSELGNKTNPQLSFTLRSLVLLAVGFLAFDAIPSLLDTRLASGLQQPVFFLLAAAVFINVHHFFLDSVLWRFQDGNMRATILAADDARRR